MIAYATNTSGQIVGEFVVDGMRHTFLWSHSSGFQDLGTLNAWTNSEGFAINENGDVAGMSYPTIVPPEDGFLWTANEGMQGIGFSSMGTVKSLNSRQQITGWVTGSNTLHPFVWSKTAGIKDLIGELPANLRNEPHYWLARGINDAGQIVVTEDSNPLANPILLTPRMHVSLTSSANPSQVGQAITFTASLTSVQGPPPDGEKIMFKDNTRTIGAVVLHNGTASLTYSKLTVGTHPITATYVGDINYAVSKSGIVSQVVNP
jgi:probable HAF family extracellular repeat protein